MKAGWGPRVSRTLYHYLVLEEELTKLRHELDAREQPILDRMDMFWCKLTDQEREKLDRVGSNCWPGVPCRGRFLTREEGGREQPPTGRVYKTVARINGVEASVILHAAAIQWLVPSQPDLPSLEPGTKFELYEGSKKVFEGVIL